MRPSSRQNRSPRWKNEEWSRASWSRCMPCFADRSTRTGRRPDRSDRGAEVHVVDEPMLERDVGLEWGRPKLAGLLPVFRRLPRLAKGDAGAGRQAALDLQGHVLKRDDLLVAGERSPQG